MQFEVVSDLPATMQFDRETIYTLRRGPNAGRAVKYTGPGKAPYEDMVHIMTADGKSFSAGTGRQEAHRTGVCLPSDLVPK